MEDNEDGRHDTFVIFFLMYTHTKGAAGHIGRFCRIFRSTAWSFGKLRTGTVQTCFENGYYRYYRATY